MEDKKQLKGPKHYFVPWQGYDESDNYRDDRKLDTLCLHGPHSLSEAHDIAAKMRSFGRMASVIDCTNSLRYAHAATDLLNALRIARAALKSALVLSTGNMDNYKTREFNEALEQVDAAITKARGDA